MNTVEQIVLVDHDVKTFLKSQLDLYCTGFHRQRCPELPPYTTRTTPVQKAIQKARYPPR